MRMVLGVLALTMFLSQSASASVTFTYNGFVSLGFDQSGLFGAPNTSLTGATFSLSFSTDSAPLDLGNGFLTILDDISAALTINSHTYKFSSQSNSAYHYIMIAKTGGRTLFANSTTSGWNEVNMLGFAAYGPSSPLNLTQDFSYSFAPGETNGTGEFVNCFLCRENPQPDRFYNFARLQFTPVVEPGVPEPSTWAMLLIGFVGLGFVTYRRRSHLKPT